MGLMAQKSLVWMVGAHSTNVETLIIWLRGRDCIGPVQMEGYCSLLGSCSRIPMKEGFFHVEFKADSAWKSGAERVNCICLRRIMSKEEEDEL